MTLIEEARAAALGCLAVLRGERDAPAYFDLTLRGLLGSLIALLIVVGIQVHLPGSSDAGGPGLTPFGQLLFVGAVAALWIVVLYYFLKTIGRDNRLVPFLVVNNWGSVYASLIWIALALFGFGGVFGTFLVGVGSIYFFVRTALIVIELRPVMILALMGVQLVAGLFALMLLGLLLPGAAPQ